MRWRCAALAPALALVLSGCAATGPLRVVPERSQRFSWPRQLAAGVGAAAGAAVARQHVAGEAVKEGLFVLTGAALGYGLAWSIQWAFAQENEDKAEKARLLEDLTPDVVKAAREPGGLRLSLLTVGGGLAGGLAVWAYADHQARNAASKDEAIGAELLKAYGTAAGVLAGALLGWGIDALWRHSTAPELQAEPGPKARVLTAADWIDDGDSRWRAGDLRGAWGAYRRAKDMGSMDPGLDAKMLELEEKIRSEASPR